jgi:uncharacterized membrane protein
MAEERRAISREQELERAIVTRGLRMGVWVSATLILLGLSAWVAGGRPVLQAFHVWGREAHFTWAHASGFLLSAGILGLVFTPILRVILMAWVYWRLGDRVFLAVSLLVLALLVLSASLGAGA